jgi:hypothetical protein
VLLELYQCKSRLAPYDRCVGWAAAPLVTAGFEIAGGKFKAAMLRGEVLSFRGNVWFCDGCQWELSKTFVGQSCQWELSKTFVGQSCQWELSKTFVGQSCQ